MQRRTISLLALGIASFFLIGACMASLFGKTELTPEWVERFNKVAQLNEYAQSHTVQLSNVVLTSYDLTGVKLKGAAFENTEWKGTQLNKSSLTNTQFKKTKLDGVKFQESVLSDVTFEDVELREVSFFKATLKHVKFVRCNFDAVTADNLKTSDVEFIDSKLVNSSFSEGQLIAVVKNSNLNDVEFTDLEIPSSLTFEKSELREVNFSRSHLSNFSLTSVNADKYGFEGGTVDKVDIRDSYFGIGMREVQIGSLTIARSKIESRFTLSKIDSVDISNCQAVIDLGFYKSTVGTLSVRECALENFRAIGATITTMKIKDSQLRNNEFKNLKAGIVTFENVTLDQKIDFTNAQVDQLTAKNITKHPGLNLLTTGSNVKLD